VCRLESEEGFHSLTAKSRGLPWSFEWGLCFPLAYVHFLGVWAVACFSVTTFQEAEEVGYRLRYLTTCLALAFLTLLLSEQFHFCRLLMWR